MPTQTESRKKDHIDLVLEKGAQYKKTAGFERIDLVHNALPEISLADVDLSTEFLGKKVRYPIIIEAMTGGYPDAKGINKGLAKAAQEHGLAFGVGSQRAMLEDQRQKETFEVRDVAPDIPLLANIGAYQLKKYQYEQIESLVSSIGADGLAVHLNPLQEVIQEEGDTDYTGILDAIANTCKSIDVPVIVKETGAGMSQDVALKLKGAGVAYIDLAGAGGTSWSKVEYMRSSSVPGFGEWGIPTVHSIVECRGVLPMIASGGIRSGIDAAKATALGADMAGAAYPFLKALKDTTLDGFLSTFTGQMKVAAYLTGSATYSDLKKAKTVFL